MSTDQETPKVEEIMADDGEVARFIVTFTGETVCGLAVREDGRLTVTVWPDGENAESHIVR